MVDYLGYKILNLFAKLMPSFLSGLMYMDSYTLINIKYADHIILSEPSGALL